LQAATPLGVDRRTPHRQTRQGPSCGGSLPGAPHVPAAFAAIPRLSSHPPLTRRCSASPVRFVRPQYCPRPLRRLPSGHGFHRCPAVASAAAPAAGWCWWTTSFRRRPVPRSADVSRTARWLSATSPASGHSRRRIPWSPVASSRRA